MSWWSTQPWAPSLTTEPFLDGKEFVLMFSISISVSLTDKLLPIIVVLVNSFWRKELFHRRSLVFTQLESFYSNFQYLLLISTQNKIVSCVNISFKIILNAYCNNNIPYIHTYIYILLFLPIFSICQILINPYVPLSSPLNLIFLNSLN